MDPEHRCAQPVALGCAPESSKIRYRSPTVFIQKGKRPVNDITPYPTHSEISSMYAHCSSQWERREASHVVGGDTGQQGESALQGVIRVCLGTPGTPCAHAYATTIPLFWLLKIKNEAV